MKCDVCNTKMNNSTTETEISIDGKMIRAVNVPSLICPECNKLVIEDSVSKQVRAYAERCKGDTFDYKKEEDEDSGAIVAAATIVV
jgi:YgiT-type zinc finger domain-containing protein